MKLKNLFAGVMASAVAATALAAAASANDAFLMYTDDSWAWGVWDAASCPGTADVTGDGTYTVYIDSSIDGAKAEDEETGELAVVQANGAMVFCVDVEGLAEEYGFGKGAEGYDDLKTTAEKMAFAQQKGITIEDLAIKTYNADGTTNDIAVDLSKILYGDIEGNGKLRIEIQNEYGDTLKDPAIDKSTISFDDKIEVTFTVKGLDGADEAAASADAWDQYDFEAMKEMNESFELGGKLDLVALLGEGWNKFTKIEADFSWTPGEKWCGGAGIANGLVNGETWNMGAEFGAANANEALAPDGFATQTILDLGAPLESAYTVDEDGKAAFAELQVQNWWNGTEAGAKVLALRFLDADNNVIAEWEAPDAGRGDLIDEEPAPVSGDVAAAAETSKGSPDTGVADVAAVTGLAVIAAGAVVVAKKRK